MVATGFVKVDHGLGGKDGVRSREKRAKRAERQKVKAHNSITKVKNKTEVVFNEEDRVKWLTGFRKRKTERRKFGLAMQIVKEKKLHKEALKVKRKASKEARGEVPDKNTTTTDAATIDLDDKVGDDDDDNNDNDNDDDNNDNDDDDDDDDDMEADGRSFVEPTVQTFVDEGTMSMFGGAVAVQVGTELGEEDHNDLQEDEVAAAAARLKARELMKKPQLSMLEKAVKKVQQSGALSRRRKKSKPSEDGDLSSRGGKRLGKKQLKRVKQEKKASVAKSLMSKARKR